MKKTMLITATALLILTACSENKENEKKQTTQQEQKVEVKQETKTENIVEKNSVKQEEKAEEQEKLVKSIEEPKVVDAQTLFKSCSSCHGQKAEKEALGKSQVIAGWDKDRIINALNGYKDGTYGGAMKSVMKPHVDKRTAEEIEAIAVFISNL